MMLVSRVDNPALFYLFDVLRASFSPEASTTDHPVEFGAEVTDHVQVRPQRFTVDAIVTDSPRSTSLAPGGVELARTFLEGALGQLLSVTIDGEGVFLNCVLERFPHERTNREGRVFACSFKQIRIASAISVPIPARLPAPAAAAGAPTEAPLGQQAVSPVPTTSYLFDLRAFLSPF